MAVYDDYNSPLGSLMLAASEWGLCMCMWKDSYKFQDIRREMERYYGPSKHRNSPAFDYFNAKDPQWGAACLEALDTAARQLDEYFSGRRRKFDLSLQFPGEEDALDIQYAMTDIEYGQTVTYSELSEIVGRPKAVRQVSRQIGLNTVDIFVPCHRVVAKQGVGGYNGGAERKRVLLDFERRNCASETPLAFTDLYKVVQMEDFRPFPGIF